MNRITAITIIAVALLATLSVLVVFHADRVVEDGVVALIGVAIPSIVRILAGSDEKKESLPEKGAGPLAVLAVVGAAFLAEGCEHAPPVLNVENAAAVAQYEALLADCRSQGKAAGSYAVYEACANAVDRKLCAENGVRCTDGGAR